MAHEHTFATPGPAGMASLAVACFGFAAVFLGKVTIEGLPLLACWLVGAGIVQYTTAVMELKDHNITGGNVFLFFAAFFCFAAALSVFAKFMMIKFGMKPAVVIEGWMWAVGAAFLTVVTPAYGKANAMMFFLVLIVDVVLWMLVGIDSGWYGDPAILRPACAWLLLITGVIAIYLAGAIVCNTVYGKAIYWIPKPLIK
jgi:uncharacterized protein